MLFLTVLLTAAIAKAFAGATPWIRAVPRPEQNLIHLEWGMEPASETGSYNYMIYKREAGEAEFQSIPVKGRVRVLNIYPPVGENITFTNWKGQTFTLPKAASLKRWMEEPNAEHLKGYGMGLIDVDAVSIPDFNANPVGYLKNPDGSWKYDVVAIGTWDTNNGQDVSINALDLLKEFVKTGGGLLLGHDTVAHSASLPYNLNVFTPNLQTLGSYLRLYDAPQYNGKNPPDLPNEYQLWGGTEVVVARKGLLTNYPWKIGEVGTVLNIPYTHTGWMNSRGDVWLKFLKSDPIKLPNGSTTWPYNIAQQWEMHPSPEANWYLTTWSNVAMIQTGHSNCEATPDEQKIIANTLFYLAQVTDGTSWDDRSAQDVAPPDPVAGIQTNPMPGGVEITWQRPNDNGNTYYYFVQAINKVTGDRLNSAVVGPVSYATGIKGYVYTIDQNPNTDPGTVVNLTQEKVSLALAPGKYYLHLRVVDNAGNLSEVRHFPVEVSFDLQAALEPNPAMRGQKVKVYAAVLQSNLTLPPELSGWQYAKEIVVTNNSARVLTEFQVRVIVDTATEISSRKMRPDCADIRFVMVDDLSRVIIVPYFMDGGANTTATPFWIKIPSLPPNSSVKVYMLYGKPDAPPVSNGPATFEAFRYGDLDAYITSVYYPYQNFVNGSYLYVGGWADYYYSLLKIPSEMVPRYVTPENLEQAELKMVWWGMNPSARTQTQTVRLRRITSPWEPPTVTWYTRPSFAATDLAVFSQTIPSPGWMVWTPATPLSWVSFNITDWIRRWLSGAYQNYGLIWIPDNTDGVWINFGSENQLWFGK